MADHYDEEQQIFTADTARGRITVTILTAAIMRVQLGATPSTRRYAAQAIQEKTAVTVATTADATTLTTSAIAVTVTAAGFVDAALPNGEPLLSDYRQAREPQGTTLSERDKALLAAEGHSTGTTTGDDKPHTEVIKALTPTMHLYGLGDKAGFLDRRGYAYDDWNTDDPSPHLEFFTKLYKSIPFILGLDEGRAFGLFFDDPNPHHFDLGKENPAYFYYTSQDVPADYYLIAGPDPLDVVSRYTALTGRAPLPPKWALGHQQSRWSYSSQAEVLALAKRYRQERIPLDVIHLDIDYMDGYRVFTVDKTAFPDFAGMVKQLQQMGIRIVTIIDPGVKVDPQYRLYEDGLARDAYVKTPSGDVYHNRVWPGEVGYPDFGAPAVREWWASQQKTLTDLGVSGVWDDMNEPASFTGEIPEDIVFSDEQERSTHRHMHNLYGHNMAKATYDGLRQATGLRPFVITRAGFAGTQRYSSTWTGDNTSIWAHLQLMIPQLTSLGLSGYPFAGTDIGGFGEDTTAELLTRWLEAAVFSPLFRNHSAKGTRHQEPWTFDTQTLRIYRQYVELRYHLLDYLYDLFENESRTGMPLMRPLMLAYPQDEAVLNLNDEYMVGASLLVAPVVTPGTRERMVYLPAGDWVDYWTGVPYAGQQSIIADAPIDRLPLFVKANSLLPWRPLSQSVNVARERKLQFKLFGLAGSYSHYQDDGASFAYEDGDYNRYDIVVDEAAGPSVTLSHRGQTVQPYQEVTVDDRFNDAHRFVFEPTSGAYQEAR